MSALERYKLTSDAALDPEAGLLAVAVAHAFELFGGVSMAANISGGHFESSFHLWIGCWWQHNCVDWFLTALPNCLAPQLLASSSNLSLMDWYVFAIPTDGVGAGLSGFEGVVMEIVITFALVYTVYATAADLKKGSLGTIAPIAIGFIVGANILAASPFVVGQ
ncbi:hypothetical protein HAX54_018895 [Datura stramonium]|uniref:Tonoplast intrinsic protein n=1 Tax=Datura stramonium TaxID=4076 RepID=A0ABS8RJY9_DATST|nr:hypothetical protein [Datura stramonium]